VRELTYQEAIKKLVTGIDVYVLPEGLNPRYLAFGVQKISPIAVLISGREENPATREEFGRPAKPATWRNKTHAEAKAGLCAARECILEECWNEPGSSHTKVRYYTTEEKESECTTYI
jgi:hypothetical protein